MSVTIRYYASIFLRRLPYFLIVAAMISAAAITAALTMAPAYVSQTRLIVESPQIPDNLAASTASTPAQEQLQIVEQRLLTRANLLDIANRLNVFEDQEGMNPDWIVQSMRARTTIRSTAGRDQASLMTITFEAPSAVTAAGVLNEYLSLIQQEDIQSRTQRASQTLEFFEQEVSRLSERLAERSARILEFKTENADALPESLQFMLSQQTLLQERLAQTEREIASLADQRARIISIFEATGQVAGVGGAPGTPEQQQLETLRRELDQALAVYSEENPQVKVLKSRISRLESVVSAQPLPESETLGTGNSLLDVQLAELGSRLDILEEQKRTTASQLEELTGKISRIPGNAIRLDELELDYENVQLQYNTAVDRLSRASTGERIELMSRGQRIAIIEPPAVPEGPTKPNRVLIAGGGTIFGILAGIGMVILLEFLNQSVRRPEELISRLGVTPLATIPYIHTRAETFRRRSMKLLSVLVILVGIPASVYVVHTYYQPLDLITERVMDRVGVRW